MQDSMQSNSKSKDSSNKESVATMKEFMDYRFDKIEELIEKLPQMYVSRSEFMPIKNIVYGGVMMVLTSFFGALIAIVIKNQ